MSLKSDLNAWGQLSYLLLTLLSFHSNQFRTICCPVRSGTGDRELIKLCNQGAFKRRWVMEEWPLEFPKGRTRNTCTRHFLLRLNKQHLCPKLPSVLQVWETGNYISQAPLPLRGTILGRWKAKAICISSYKQVCRHRQTAGWGLGVCFWVSSWESSPLVLQAAEIVNGNLASQWFLHFRFPAS